jgi:hypothetical protein
MVNFLNYGKQKQTHPQTHFRHFGRRDIVRDFHDSCLANQQVIGRLKPNFCAVFGQNESALLRLNFSLPGGDGFKIGATEPKTVRQHFNLLFRCF